VRVFTDDYGRKDVYPFIWLVYSEKYIICLNSVTGTSWEASTNLERLESSKTIFEIKENDC
jgi:hypothetical protein